MTIINEIQYLQEQGATLRFFNGADWYIEHNGIIHWFNTVFQEHKQQSEQWSKNYCSTNGIRNDFKECIQSYLNVRKENKQIREGINNGRIL